MAVSWEPAVRDAYQKKRRWRYFTIANTSKMTEYEADYYEKTQNAISKELIETTDRTLRAARGLELTLDAKKTSSLSREAALYGRIFGNARLYTEMSDEERVQAWTNYYYRNLVKTAKNPDDLDPYECVSIIIHSSELYNYLKSSATEIFTRTKLMAGHKNFAKKKTENLTTGVIKELATFDSSNAIMNGLTLAMTDTTNEDVKATILSGLSTQIETILRGRKGSKTVSKAKANLKAGKIVTASTFSKNLRAEIKEAIDAYNKNATIPVESFVLSQVDGGEFLKVYSSDQGLNKNELYTNMNPNAVFMSVMDVFRQKFILMKNVPVTEFHLLKIGTFKLDKNNQKQIENFYEKAILYIANPTFLNYLEKSVVNSEKFFKAGNANMYVSGLLGELSGFLHFSTGLIKGYSSVEVTGSAYSDIAGTTYGEVHNDLTVRANNGENNFGVNIKHFIANTGHSITLYSSKTAMNVFSPYMLKYFSEEEVTTLKYMAANISFRNDDFNGFPRLNEAVTAIAEDNIMNFLRIEDRRDKIQNLFFQLNNVIYPVSYIYQMAIDELTKDDYKFFDIKTEAGSQKIYKTRKIALRYWNPDDYLIGNSKKKTDGKIQIGTNGLKVNLVGLDLFK